MITSDRGMDINRSDLQISTQGAMTLFNARQVPCVLQTRTIELYFVVMRVFCFFLLCHAVHE